MYLIFDLNRNSVKINLKLDIGQDFENLCDYVFIVSYFKTVLSTDSRYDEPITVSY